MFDTFNSTNEFPRFENKIILKGQPIKLIKKYLEILISLKVLAITFIQENGTMGNILNINIVL